MCTHPRGILTLPLFSITMPSSFSLSPMVEADMPGICAVSGAAFEKDRHTMLRAAHPTQPYHHAGGMGEAVKYWLSLPKERILPMKAVDHDTGQVIAFGVWGLRLKPPQPQPGTTTRPTQSVGQQHYTITSNPNLDGLAQLRELTDSHFSEFQNSIMPHGVRCLYVVAINVHPDHQGRGVGSALMKLGTHLADQERVFAWVHSSDEGVEFYRRCGFDIDDTLEIDFDHWAGLMSPKIKPPAGDEKWGTYTFRYMIRQSKAVTKQLISQLCLSHGSAPCHLTNKETDNSTQRRPSCKLCLTTLSPLSS